MRRCGDAGLQPFKILIAMCKERVMSLVCGVEALGGNIGSFVWPIGAVFDAFKSFLHTFLFFLIIIY